MSVHSAHNNMDVPKQKMSLKSLNLAEMLIGNAYVPVHVKYVGEAEK